MFASVRQAGLELLAKYRALITRGAITARSNVSAATRKNAVRTMESVNATLVGWENAAMSAVGKDSMGCIAWNLVNVVKISFAIRCLAVCADMDSRAKTAQQS